MHRRPLRRATILGLISVLAFAGTAFADQLLADGNLDPDWAGVQGTKFLGDVAPGAVISADVEFTLNCVLLSHVDNGQTVILSWSGLGSEPPGGAIVSVTSGSVGPVGAGWGVDGSGCPAPTPTMTGTTTHSTVTLRAPTTPLNNYMYTIVYDRSLSPAGNNDAGAFSRSATQVSFTLNVVPPPNAAPTLDLPFSHEEEGNTTGGWTADWSAVSASDPEDDPDPTPTCTPAAGLVLPVGLTTTVSCSVRDLAGATTSGTFDIKVVDTTDPVLAGVPADIAVTTGQAGDVAVSYDAPTATDIVDADPAVDCSPASGSPFPVGKTTTVTCTATDDSGNSASGSFTVTVQYVAPPHSASAIWLEPVAGGVFEANHSRSIPVKVRLFVDGVERPSGHARLTLTPCGGGDVALDLPLAWSGGRWNASVDTSMLAGSCYKVAASIDGFAAGSFELDLRGDTVAAKAKSTTLATKPGPKKPR